MAADALRLAAADKPRHIRKPHRTCKLRLVPRACRRTCRVRKITTVVELADKANRNHRDAALGMRITGGVPDRCEAARDRVDGHAASAQ
jgi:hypothetical protein